LFQGSAGVLGWSSTTGASGTADTAFSRISAGVIGVGTGAQGSTAGTLSCAELITGNAGGIAISMLQNTAIRDSTAVSTDALFIDFPNITFRDPSAGFAILATLATGGSFTATSNINTTSGIYFSQGTAGVTAGPFTAITSIATKGGIVTTLADVSDERLKNASPYEGGLEIIKSISPIRFTYNEDGMKITGFGKDRTFVGFSAQNVQKALPEAVVQSGTHPDYLSFDPRPVIAALVNAVKELKAELDTLKAR
jgi:hypothetical protein